MKQAPIGKTSTPKGQKGPPVPGMKKTKPGYKAPKKAKVTGQYGN